MRGAARFSRCEPRDDAFAVAPAERGPNPQAGTAYLCGAGLR